jgi:ActR/RegA family two-component response regulator
MCSAANPLVVIIEDDDASAEALSFVLRDWGADVVRGQDADAVLSQLGPAADRVDYIITDFNLGPGPNGVALTQSLIPHAPRARVLVLTGSFQGRAASVAAKAGFELMYKPAQAHDIIAWLQRS